MSRTVFVICYAGCPIFWLSKLQSEVALSTTEAEYIALLKSLRDVIPLLNIIAELQQVFIFPTHQALLSCSLFEDNAGALALALDHKTRPHTKQPCWSEVPSLPFARHFGPHQDFLYLYF